jgi:ribosomal protein S18 acetylase RimI-like enzyme
VKNSGYSIKKLQSKDDIPFNLLLLADETREAIEKYIYNSDVYVLTKKEELQPVAVFVLYKISETEIEIKNIAVAEVFQDKGIGSYLISEIRNIAKKENFNSIIVGTPDIALRQINFYQKNGFTKCGRRKNFFIDNYSEPIFEDGIMLKDMIILKTSV